MKYFILIILSTLLLSCNNSKTVKLEANLQNKNQEYNAGKKIYQDMCINCHMPNGKGVNKVFPPLAQSDFLMQNRKASIKAIKYGLSEEITVNKIKYNNVMSPLGLTNKEVAHVMNYITNSWGNKNETLITEEEVSEIEP